MDPTTTTNSNISASNRTFIFYQDLSDNDSVIISYLTCTTAVLCYLPILLFW